MDQKFECVFIGVREATVGSLKVANGDGIIHCENPLGLLTERFPSYTLLSLYTVFCIPTEQRNIASTLKLDLLFVSSELSVFS